MYILLAAATSFEIQPTLDQLPQPANAHLPQQTSDQNPRPASDHSTHEIAPLITGVGSLQTIYTLMRQIGSRKPDLIIQAGIAGCFTGRPNGEVLAITTDCMADLGVWEDNTFKSVFDLKLAAPNQLPYSNGLLVNPYQSLIARAGLPTAAAITVNEITTAKNKIDAYQQKYSPVVESMEGAALHYTCIEEQIPFLQLRSISNVIGVRDKTKWNIPLAIGNLNAAIIDLLNKLDKSPV